MKPASGATVFHAGSSSRPSTIGLVATIVAMAWRAVGDDWGVGSCADNDAVVVAISAMTQKNDDARGAASPRICADEAEETRMTESGKLIDKELTGLVIGGFYSVYNAFGYGFSERVCCSALEFEFGSRGLVVEREVPKQVFYRGKPIAIYRIGMIVERRLLIEVKASLRLVEADHKQLLNYLRVTDREVGLLLHFGPAPAFHRMVCTRKPFRLSGRP